MDKAGGWAVGASILCFGGAKHKHLREAETVEPILGVPDEGRLRA